MASKNEVDVNGKSEKMLLLMKKFESSDQTQRSFYEAHGVPRSTFQYWLRRYREAKQEPSCIERGFVPLAIEPAETSPSTAGIVINYRDGTRVELHTPVEASFIRQLIGQ